jgi:hypothetical protein
LNSGGALLGVSKAEGVDLYGRRLKPDGKEYHFFKCSISVIRNQTYFLLPIKIGTSCSPSGNGHKADGLILA